MSTSITINGDESAQRHNRLVICMLITQAVIPIFFAVSITYMHLSVQTAYEMEYVEDEPSSGTVIFALDHFPGFRFSFSGLVLCLILTEVILKKGAGRELLATLILLITTSILFFYIQFYQLKHDRFLESSETMKIALLSVYYISVACIMLYYIVTGSRLFK